VGNKRFLIDFLQSIFIASFYPGLRHERTPGCLCHIKCLGGQLEERNENLMERLVRLRMIFQSYDAFVEFNTSHRYPIRRSNVYYTYVCLFGIIIKKENA